MHVPVIEFELNDDVGNHLASNRGTVRFALDAIDAQDGIGGVPMSSHSGAHALKERVARLPARAQPVGIAHD